MRRRNNYDLYVVIVLAIVTVAFFMYNHSTAETRGFEHYSSALEKYKKGELEDAYIEFGKVPADSSLKHPALFRQARCATALSRPEIAIKKYKKISHSSSKTAIVPLSEYNLANILYESKNNEAARHYANIIKKYPESDYAIASHYYLGVIHAADNQDSSKLSQKNKEKAGTYFTTYIEKAPDGRFAMSSIDEILKLDNKLSYYDRQLIAKAYYVNGEYDKAKEFAEKTSFPDSWTDKVKIEYKLGNTNNVQELAQKGLTQFAQRTDQKDVFEIIDCYVSTFPTRKEGITKLNSLNLSSTGADYAGYLNCSEIAEGDSKEACYVKLYEKYPNGQFSADSLYNVFISKYLKKKYYDAQRLGILHLKKFPNVKSSPAVTYFMGKISYKLKHYESADNYYKKVLALYPDSYYAFRAHYNLYKDDGFLPFLEVSKKPVVFPYKKSLEGDLVVKLALLKDYDLVEELCKQDKFIQSWIAYEKGNYTISSVLARNAMEDVYPKPSYSDLRWRLVYPLHYYDSVLKLKGNNNPIIVESIIKEESHFNPKSRSSAGAVGLMQLMPATLDEVVKNNESLSHFAESETSNIAAGITYYAGLKRALGNKDLYALAAYNGGIGSVMGWFSKLKYNDTDEFVEQIPYPETKNYVKKVLRTYWMYGNIY